MQCHLIDPPTEVPTALIDLIRNTISQVSDSVSPNKGALQPQWQRAWLGLDYSG